MENIFLKLPLFDGYVVDSSLINQAELNEFLKENGLTLVEKIGKGFSSIIYLVKAKDGRLYALKIQRIDSPRKDALEREFQNLSLANRHGIGPKIIAYDKDRKILLMEFIDGISFRKWILQRPEKEKLRKFLIELFKQAKKLDEIGLSHGQLAGKGTNILVNKQNMPVIIDFEKASTKRKCRNLFQLISLIVTNPHSIIPKIVREILQS